MTTLLARLTPPGRSAIAVVSLRGSDAWTILASAFRRRSGLALPATPKPDAMLLGFLGEGKASDEVVVRVIATEHIEIHCHGGPEAVRLVEETLAARDAEVGVWQQLEGLEEPAWRIEAMETLMQAPTVRTAAIALDQWNGVLHGAVAEIAELRNAGEIAEATRREARLRELQPVGEHLVRPWKVVLAGSPNVGKSSLINALAGFERSVVSPTPGTTRDVVTSQIALDGWPVLITDTAGLRSEADQLEREGMGRAERSIGDADLVVWVLDASQPDDRSEYLGPTKRSIVVANKCDLPRRRELEEDAIETSAVTGQGIADLADHIVNQLVRNPPLPGEAVPLDGWFGELSNL